MEKEAVAVAVAAKQEQQGGAPNKSSLAKEQERHLLEQSITDLAAALRLRRDELKRDNVPWRSDAKAMEQVFQLMRLKFAHPKFRHESLPEGETQTVIKLRWKVVGADGKVVVLQRPFRQTPGLSAQQAREAVAAYSVKKCLGVAPFEQIQIVEKDGRKGDLTDELRLKVVFPGPKFETVRVVKLECVNAAWVEYCRNKPGREEKHKAKLAEDKVRVEQRKEAKRAAKEAAQAAAGPAGGAGRGRGRGAVKAKAAPKGPAKGVAAKGGAPKKAVPAKGGGRGRGH